MKVNCSGSPMSVAAVLASFRAVRRVSEPPSALPLAATSLDALKAGFETVLVEDGCRGVGDDTSAEALAEMRQAGVQFCRGSEVVG